MHFLLEDITEKIERLRQSIHAGFDSRKMAQVEVEKALENLRPDHD